ncbi:MAG: hypothetical protein IR164_07615 [Devosia sp.]|uniref:restriction endonuclease subunit S n=1 Tax=Devosia sp. TaxID=1871048 RepID=UPI0019E06581|nr:hypothetical protein [Devosia sp.]MBF0678789.1 hypothetical protein [Devosia sp.]
MSDEFDQQWLGGLPADWSEKRADFLCDPYRVTVDPSVFGDDLVAHYSIPQVQETGGPIIEPASDIDSTKLLITAPTLLVSKLNPRKRTICIAEPHGEHPTLASGEFVAIKSDAMDRRYAYYLWCSQKVTDRLSAIVQSATRSHQRVNPSDILKLPWKWPPFDTQHRIARFLDERTGRIDGLIEKKRALLDRLAEKHQALITRAVTKGLNPDAPMKPSGIDWLGDIPTHWEVLPLRRVLRSSTYGISASLEPAGDVAVLRMGNLTEGEIDFGDLRFLDDVDQNLILEAGDVVFNRTNSLDLVGKAAIFRGGADFPVSLASYLVRFRFTERYLPEYANFVMGTEGLLRLARTLALPSIGQANLNPSRYAEIEFSIPPVPEQAGIVSYLAEQTDKLRSASEKITQSLRQLTEYRAALITAAITGQVADLA